MAVVHSVVKKHGGHVSVESAVSVGTTFTLHLPALKKAPCREMRNDRKAAPASPSSRLHVLVLDDEEAICDVCEAILMRHGYDVSTARNGEEAILKCNERLKEGKPFDVALMDLVLPGGMGGEVAVRHLRKLDPKIKTIVCSGYSNHPVMANYQQYGFDAVLPKPYPFEKLLQKMNELLPQKVTAGS